MNSIAQQLAQLSLDAVAASAVAAADDVARLLATYTERKEDLAFLESRRRTFKKKYEELQTRLDALPGDSKLQLETKQAKDDFAQAKDDSAGTEAELGVLKAKLEEAQKELALANANVKLIKAQAEDDQAKISLARTEFEEAKTALEVAVAKVALATANVSGDSVVIAAAMTRISQIEAAAATAATQRFELKRVELKEVEKTKRVELETVQVQEVEKTKRVEFEEVEKTKRVELEARSMQMRALLSSSWVQSRDVMERFIIDKADLFNPVTNDFYGELDLEDISPDNFNNFWGDQADAKLEEVHDELIQLAGGKNKLEAALQIVVHPILAKLLPTSIPLSAGVLLSASTPSPASKSTRTKSKRNFKLLQLRSPSKTALASVPVPVPAPKPLPESERTLVNLGSCPFLSKLRPDMAVRWTGDALAASTFLVSVELKAKGYEFTLDHKRQSLGYIRMTLMCQPACRVAVCVLLTQDRVAFMTGEIPDRETLDLNRLQIKYFNPISLKDKKAVYWIDHFLRCFITRRQAFPLSDFGLEIVPDKMYIPTNVLSMTSHAMVYSFPGNEKVVKLIRPGNNSWANFEREKSILSELDGVDGVSTLLTSNDTWRCLVFPYLGKPLDRNWANNPIIADDLIDTLEAIHAKNVIHRDIRQSNVLMDGENLTVIDFGLAVAMDDNREYVGKYVGTSQCSPQEHLQLSDSNPHSDRLVYSAATDLESVVKMWIFSKVEPVEQSNVEHLRIHGELYVAWEKLIATKPVFKEAMDAARNKEYEKLKFILTA